MKFTGCLIILLLLSGCAYTPIETPSASVLVAPMNDPTAESPAQAPGPALNDPEAFLVQPGPAGAQALLPPQPAASPRPAPVPRKEKQAYEAGRQYREQYIAAKRPVFQLKFRHQYPTMSEKEIEILVNDALEDGLRETAEQDMRRYFDGPGMRPSVLSPPVSCTSSQVGSYTYTDCY